MPIVKAQIQGTIMSVFFLVQIETISDEGMYREYIGKVIPIITKYGGEYVLRSEKITIMTGNWNLKRILLIRFASKEKIQECLQSGECKEIAHLREISTTSKAIIIEE